MKSAVVLLVRNDAAVIAEWIAYHRIIGFDRIHILDNESTDATGRIVRDIAGRVEYVSTEVWPSGSIGLSERLRLAFRRGLEVMRSEGVEWCLFIDSDEFIACTADELIPAFLERRSANAAIALHWVFYGSSGHAVEPPGLSIENYIRRAPANFGPQALCKSLVRVPYVQDCLNAHTFILDPAYFPYVDCGGEPVQWESKGQDHVIAPWRINHYFLRSRETWERKVARSHAGGFFERQMSDWDVYDRNEFLDTSAARHAPAVRAEMARMGVPVPPPVSKNLGGFVWNGFFMERATA